MAVKQGDLALLEHPVARELLVSTIQRGLLISGRTEHHGRSRSSFIETGGSWCWGLRRMRQR